MNVHTHTGRKCALISDFFSYMEFLTGRIRKGVLPHKGYG